METVRRAVVVGASAGIGRAIALRLAADGHNVVGVARRADLLEELVRQAPQRIAAYAGDIADVATIERSIGVCNSQFAGPADLFIFSAGKGLVASLLESEEGLWDELFRVNVLGTLNAMRAAGRHLVSQLAAAPSARAQCPLDIVVIGSVTGRHVSVFNPVYGSSKFAIGSATEALRQELCKHGIRVTLLEPGIVRTEYQAIAGYDMVDFNSYESEIGPFLSPEDIARCVSFFVQEPPHVNFGSVVVRPTGQVSP
jgi:NADP-dependent 3-hydroxy acid dehydrogenase YdfG